MGEGLILALVAGGFAVAGSIVTGWFTFAAAARQNELESYRKRLRQAYQDVAAFHRLEERYLVQLANPSRSAEAIKREVRRQLREEGFQSPSEDATVKKAEQRLSEL